MCETNQIAGSLTVQSAKIIHSTDNKKSTLHLKAIYNPKPSSLTGRIAYFFQRVEFFEKISERIDECYHLFEPILRHITNKPVFKILTDLHHSAQHVEHALHAFCFFGDLSRLFTGRFLEYQEYNHKKIDVLRTLSRVCHLVSHFFSAANLLNDLKLIPLNRFKKILELEVVFSLSGYLLTTISVLWARHKKVNNPQFKSDLSIQLGGLFFEASKMTNNSIIQKLGSLAGIIHASGIINRLSGSFKIGGHFPISTCCSLEHKSSGKKE